ncbi:TRAP transporter large permease [Nitratireductor pacificus]|uniref:TRAP transporter large permease protein n=1 Tax=Nitratireductor pacificus pht-3B TaxID=391937 RepID=K2MUA9_9HYPH|nr:TRAP transporter large permease [Nitratireductor pacificus]EKF21002.1 TRAP-T family protein transporter, DctM (12 TMs) subunit [Nitratireductor pacificus pht-3B]
MSPVEQGIIALATGLILIGLRLPIGLALGLVSFFGALAILPFKAVVSLMGRIPYEFTASWEFSAVPLFLFMGNIAYHSGMTNAIFRVAERLLYRVPGGLAVATNFAAAGFGAACGSSIATTVAMGRAAIPEMLKSGYNPGLATAVCATSGTLAALIPPSIPLIVYGILAEQSVAKLFFAGVMPGLLTAVVAAGVIIIRCKLNPELAPPRGRPATSLRRSLREVWPLPVLALCVFGGIYAGIFSPTEAGAMGAFLAVLFAFATGNLKWGTLWTALQETVRSTTVILFIAIGAFMLTRYMALTGLPAAIADTVSAMQLSPIALMAAISLVFILLGMFLDPFGVMLIAISVLLPLFELQGFDLIWVGIIIVKYIELGLLTPPVGLNIFAAKSVAPPEITLPVIFRGVTWFLAGEAVVMVLLLGFPQITLWLPSIML